MAAATQNVVSSRRGRGELATSASLRTKAVAPPQGLDGIAVLAPLTPAARRELAAQCIWLNHKAGDTILNQGDTTSGIFFLVEGRARVTQYASSGRIVLFRDIPVGDVFGELAALDNLPRVASVEAVETCTTGHLPPAVLKTLLARDAAFNHALLLHMAGLVRALTTRVFEFSTLAVESRVLAEILRLARIGRVVGRMAIIDVAPTHAEIASRVSTTREGVTRTIKRLVEKGIVEKRGAGFAVRDLPALERMVASMGGNPITAAPVIRRRRR
jgi:CRP-like cAMP-binding protein